MDRSEFQDLIDLTKELLESYGLSEIADDKFYSMRRIDGTSDPVRLPDAKRHLIELLKSFERHMMVENPEVADRSIKLINERTLGTDIDTIFFEDFSADGITPDPSSEQLDIRSIPDRREALKLLRLFIEDIQDEPETQP